MKYINATKGGFIALIIFSFLTFMIPGKGSSNDIDLILTITTFLFAILAGFFISRANTRFSEIKRTISEEDALFLSLYKISQLYGKRFSNKIGDLIDSYYITAYDSETSVYNYKEGMPFFLSIWDEVARNNIFKKSEIGQGKLIDTLSDIEKNRNLTSEIAKEKISKGQWLIMLMLAIIILFCLFYTKNYELYSNIITILLSTSLIIIILILRDLRNLRFGSDESLLGESGQEVLESIGKLRYYNNKFLKKGYYIIPEYVKKYRVGYHAAGEEKLNIKILKNKKKGLKFI